MTNAETNATTNASMTTLPPIETPPIETPPWDRDSYGKETAVKSPPWDRDTYGKEVGKEMTKSGDGKVHPEETMLKEKLPTPKTKVMPAIRRRNWGSDTESDSE